MPLLRWKGIATGWGVVSGVPIWGCAAAAGVTAPLGVSEAGYGGQFAGRVPGECGGLLVGGI